MKATEEIGRMTGENGMYVNRERSLQRDLTLKAAWHVSF